VTDQRRLILKKLEHIRELRNAVNHEYEDHPARLAEFFSLLAAETPVLLGYAQRLMAYCRKHYTAN
jgi:hypothetical protein